MQLCDDALANVTQNLEYLAGGFLTQLGIILYTLEGRVDMQLSDELLGLQRDLTLAIDPFNKRAQELQMEHSTKLKHLQQLEQLKADSAATTTTQDSLNDLPSRVPTAVAVLGTAVALVVGMVTSSLVRLS